MANMTDDPRYAEGLVPARTDILTDEWVPANAFTIRGIFERGDAAKFMIDELAGIVRQYLADHGVETGHTEALLFNYVPGVNLRTLHDEHQDATRR